MTVFGMHGQFQFRPLCTPDLSCAQRTPVQGNNTSATTTDTLAPSTEPTVAGKLGEAWQSVKEAAGLAGTLL